jgi:succinate dehydrogenase / fumarate reductase iron-sulfur subunit
MTNTESRKLTIAISRYNPETDKKPYLQEYQIDTKECQGNMLLDILELIKDKYDNSLSYRSSCREGVCGSDGMCINGKNGLACITNQDSLPAYTTIRPLPGMPIIRDLVVDLSQFYAQYERAQPYLLNDELEPALERKQSPEQREKLNGLYECILCACWQCSN